MKKINAIISNNIKYYRKLKNLTQEILAEKLEVTPNYISYLERGTKVPSIELLTKIADIFEINPAILLMKDEEPKNFEIKQLIELLNSLDEPTFRFIDDMTHAVVKLKNS
ncbi:MAG: helix-turn-helix domain-containing protein [Desulfitobacteriaceae bacterium]